MSKEFFNNLLKYNQNLIDSDFLRSVLNKINQRNKKRNHIMLFFILLGAFSSATLLLIWKPIFVFVQEPNYLSTIGLTCISIFVMWLVFEETQASS